MGMWPKLKSSSSKSTSSINFFSAAGEELPMAKHVSKARSSLTLNVDEEYNKTLRTKSYTDMLTKVHNQLKTTTKSQEEEEIISSPPSSHYYAHLPNHLLEPNQETLLATPTDDATTHALLVDYFDATLHACNACASLLSSVHRTRSRHLSMLRALLQLSTVHHISILSQLSSYVDLDNPLSTPNVIHFHQTHGLYAPLIQRLRSTHRSITRRARVIRGFKKAFGLVLIAACGAVTVAALVVAAHAVVALGAVVAAVVVQPSLVVGWVRRRVESMSVRRLERAALQVETAAKGVYVMGRDLETVSRMVRRLEEEVEHGKDVVRMFLRSREREVMREVVRELESSEEGFMEQVEELEEHVYLCLLTINRSRRLLAQQMGVVALPTTAT